MDEKRIVKLMKELDCTREEAISVILEDEEIDRMSAKEVDSDLTEDQKKAKKEATKTGTRKTNGAVKRERKPDEEKEEIITKIADFLAKINGFNVKIIKKEREISLLVGENDYSITLIKHRPPKK